jgi:lysophospholipase L1-like esterase
MVIKFSIIVLVILFSMSCSDKISLPPLSNDAVILSFGDSLTYGTGSSRENAYPSVLEKLIQQQLTTAKVINAGVPGEISQEGLLRLPTLIAQHRPELIILCHGGNDILRKLNLSNTQNNIQQMFNLAEQHNIPVVLIGVPEFGLFLNASPIYQTLADDNAIPIENDILGNILAKASLKSDHIHPNKKGYQFLAESIFDLLHRTGAIIYPGSDPEAQM